MRRKIIAAIAFFALFFLSTGVFAYTPKAPVTTGRVVNAAMSGYKTFDLQKDGARVTIVNFWATWCPPCRAELPGLESFYRTFRSKGVVVLGINIDSGFPVATVRRFLKNNGITYPVIMHTYSDIINYGGISEVPQTFFINNYGRIVFHWPGELNGYVLSVVTAKILKLEKEGN